VRFMFEKQPATVTSLLTHFREGDYDAYLAAINTIGTSLDSQWSDSQWSTWLGNVQSNDTIPQVTIGQTGSGAALVNGQTKTGLGVAQGSWLQHYIDVLANQAKLVVAQNGGGGDADLYLNLGVQPGFQTYSCRPYVSGNNERCTINNPAAGRWYVGKLCLCQLQ